MHRVVVMERGEGGGGVCEGVGMHGGVTVKIEGGVLSWRGVRGSGKHQGARATGRRWMRNSTVASAPLPSFRMTPHPHTLPSRSGHWQYRFYAEATSPDNGTPRVFTSRVADPKRDPGYGSTSRMVLEAALW